MEQFVHLGDPRGHRLRFEHPVVVPGHEFGEDREAALVDTEGVLAALGRRSAELRHPEDPSAGRGVEVDRPVPDVLEVRRRQPPGVLCRVEHRRPPAGQKAHEPDGLLAELVVVARQVVELGDRVDDHPIGVEFPDAVDDGLDERLLFDLAAVLLTRYWHVDTVLVEVLLLVCSVALLRLGLRWSRRMTGAGDASTRHVA